MQRETGPRADVDERELAIAGGGRGQRGQHVRAAADLVHLVAVVAAELEQAVAVLDAEAPVCVAESVAELGLGSADAREPTPQRVGLELEHQVHDRRGEQQRREPVGLDRRRDLQQLGLVADRLELRRGQPPGGGCTVGRPRRGDASRLLGHHARLGPPPVARFHLRIYPPATGQKYSPAVTGVGATTALAL